MFVLFSLICVKLSLRYTGVFGESLSLMEGDSVLLNNNVTTIHEDDDILWKFGAEKSLIAQIKRENQTFPDERFRDRLKLNRQTGSLTIMNTRTEHAGLYEVKISGIVVYMSLYCLFSYFSAHLPVPDITRDFSQNSSSSSSSSSQQNCSLMCSVVNVGHVTLSWYKGNSLLSSISVSDLSISLSLPLEVEYQDKNTYSCVINNPISNQTQHLDISKLCQTHLVYIVLLSAAGSLLIVAAVLMCCICRKYRKTGSKAGNSTIFLRHKSVRSFMSVLQENTLQSVSLIEA
uniref:Ig-like domain-containing protein n=1 Tax=Cyprinus carpio TaxID=7962 RepID=A0A8C1LTK0_CYPCA